LRLAGTSIQGDVDCGRGQYSSALNSRVIFADAVKISGYFRLNESSVNGIVSLLNARIDGDLICQGLTFCGPVNGLALQSGTVSGGFVWRQVKCNESTELYLVNAQVGVLLDSEESWPFRDHLVLDGLVYSHIHGPLDAGHRLDWLDRQPRTAVFPAQPYQQLVTTLRSEGLEGTAIEILIGAEEARFSRETTSRLSRILRRLYREIGYGYRPQKIARYIPLVLLMGWVVIGVAKAAGVMSFMEGPSMDRIAEPLSPLAYSADAFFPFLSLHQKELWWPNAGAMGTFKLPITSCRVPCFGWLIRDYLWLHMIVGWSITAIVGAGLAGIIRRQ
jgi:hypothetical protein